LTSICSVDPSRPPAGTLTKTRWPSDDTPKMIEVAALAGFAAEDRFQRSAECRLLVKFSDRTSHASSRVPAASVMAWIGRIILPTRS
jgi:hypothetical protein